MKEYFLGICSSLIGLKEILAMSCCLHKAFSRTTSIKQTLCKWNYLNSGNKIIAITRRFLWCSALRVDNSIYISKKHHQISVVVYETAIFNKTHWWMKALFFNISEKNNDRQTTKIYSLPHLFLLRILEFLLAAMLNRFVPNASFLYSLKTTENRTVFWCFQGVEKGCIGNKCVKSISGQLDLDKIYRSSH